MVHNSRDAIIDATRRWIWLLPTGRAFRSAELHRYLWGTQALACQDRGSTRAGTPRFQSDVATAIRTLEREGVVRKTGRTWQRTALGDDGIGPE